MKSMRSLICYDGSADAQAAIERVGQLMPGTEATILVLWETTVETLTRTGSLGLSWGLAGSYSDDGGDAAVERAANDTAADGVRRASAAGLLATPRVCNRRDEIATEIIAVAADVEADVIVLGTRGRGGVESLLLGSVSSAVVHRADRPVLIIPSLALAGERRRRAGHARATVQAA